jgi:hypothetical protein
LEAVISEDKEAVKEAIAARIPQGPWQSLVAGTNGLESFSSDVDKVVLNASSSVVIGSLKKHCAPLNVFSGGIVHSKAAVALAQHARMHIVGVACGVFLGVPDDVYRHTVQNLVPTCGVESSNYNVMTSGQCKKYSLPTWCDVLQNAIGIGQRCRMFVLIYGSEVEVGNPSGGAARIPEALTYLEDIFNDPGTFGSLDVGTKGSRKLASHLCFCVPSGGSTQGTTQYPTNTLSQITEDLGDHLRENPADEKGELFRPSGAAAGGVSLTAKYLSTFVGVGPRGISKLSNATATKIIAAGGPYDQKFDKNLGGVTQVDIYCAKSRHNAVAACGDLPRIGSVNTRKACTQSRQTLFQVKAQLDHIEGGHRPDATTRLEATYIKFPGGLSMSQCVAAAISVNQSTLDTNVSKVFVACASTAETVQRLRNAACGLIGKVPENLQQAAIQAAVNEFGQAIRLHFEGRVAAFRGSLVLSVLAPIVRASSSGTAQTQTPPDTGNGDLVPTRVSSSSVVYEDIVFFDLLNDDEARKALDDFLLPIQAADIQDIASSKGVFGPALPGRCKSLKGGVDDQGQSFKRYQCSAQVEGEEFLIGAGSRSSAITSFVIHNTFLAKGAARRGGEWLGPVLMERFKKMVKTKRRQLEAQKVLLSDTQAHLLTRCRELGERASLIESRARSPKDITETGSSVEDATRCRVQIAALCVSSTANQFVWSYHSAGVLAMGEIRGILQDESNLSDLTSLPRILKLAETMNQRFADWRDAVIRFTTAWSAIHKRKTGVQPHPKLLRTIP